MAKCKIDKCENKSRSLGLCIKHYRVHYRNDNKEKLKESGKQYRVDNKEKLKKYFANHYLVNKNEIDLTNKKYAEENVGYLKKYRSQYYIKNKDKILNKTSFYSKNNRLIINKKVKERKENDPSIKARKTLSSAILMALKRNRSSKNGKSIIKYVPYTMEDLVAHLEEQFQEPGNVWMNWKNWGSYKEKYWDDNDQSTWKWNIDHIIPQSQLPYASMEDENFKLCWSLGNLRPYSAKQNIIDGNRREMLKIKPKLIEVNLPIALLFSSEEDGASFAAAINTIIFGKVRVKYDTLGILGGQYVILYYLQRNHESQEIHDEFIRLIEQEEMVEASSFGSNGGVQCDTDRGPCACGAWHKPGELWPEITHTLCIDCDELMMLHQKGLDHCSCGCEWSKGKCESQ